MLVSSDTEGLSASEIAISGSVVVLLVLKACSTAIGPETIAADDGENVGTVAGIIELTKKC